MKTHFGLYMRQTREMNALTVERLARAMGCDKGTVEAVEANLRPPPGRFLIAWANELRVTPEEIIMVYINQQIKKMCLDGGIPVLFKVVPADWREVRTQGAAQHPDDWCDPSKAAFS